MSSESSGASGRSASRARMATAQMSAMGVAARVIQAAVRLDAERLVAVAGRLVAVRGDGPVRGLSAGCAVAGAGWPLAARVAVRPAAP